MNKIKQLLTILSFAPALCMAQTSTENYVQTMTMLDASGNDSISAVQYYNGLGYPTVSVANAGSNGETAYSLTTYDALGREECKYLPVTIGNSVEYVTPDKVITAHKDKTAFNQNHYDALDRVTSVELPGKAWRDNDKRNRTEYSANTDADKVRIYKANQNGKYSLQKTNKFYTAGSLTKEVVKDADNKTVITFKDLFGNVVLQRANDGTNNLDTYYVYDDLGRLCYVLSPQYQNNGTKAINCYEYRYDERGRIRKKILPGCKEIQYWYDNADRLICMQDGVMKTKGKSRFYMYDNLGRLVIQGLYSVWNYNSTFFRDNSAVTTFDGTKEGFHGTGYTVPDKFIEVPDNAILEIVNYYDGNQRKIKGSFKDKFKDVSFSYADTLIQKGQLTGTVTLAGSIKAKDKEYLACFMEYDVKGNLIKSKSREIGGRIVTNTNSYTFTNNLAYSKYDVDKGNDNLLSVKENLEYNKKNNKKQKSTLSITYGGNNVKSEMGYAYDALGRLDSISRPSSGVKYEYDLHGWLKKIKTNCFTEEIFYADWSEPAYNCYNGNIGVIRWTNSTYDLSQYKYGYKYTYDGANRLTDAVYCRYKELLPSIGYSEKMQYDANGNIVKLVRQGQTKGTSNGGVWSIMDNLTISYYGNQLQSVSETIADNNIAGSFEYKKANGSQYIYNENGSLVADRSRGIAYITYDLNNNPDSIFFTNGSMTKYVYSASGQKLRVVHYTAKPNMNKAWGVKPKFSTAQILQQDSTDYLLGGSLVMQNGKVNKFLFEGGFALVRAASNKFAFYYYNQDHLGNNREVVNANGSIYQTTNYYAFGTPYEDSTPSQYKYNGKELDRMHGLDTYDYGARQYDPILARWDRMDPLSEKYYSTSPYAYCANNPVKFIDPDGRKIVLTGDSVAVADAVSLYNEGAGCNAFSYDNETGTVVYTPSETPNEYEKEIGGLVNKEKIINLRVVSGDEKVLVADWTKRKIDVADMKAMTKDGLTGAQIILHESVEQDFLQSFWPVMNSNDTKIINIIAGVAHQKALDTEKRICKIGGLSNEISPDKTLFSVKLEGNKSIDFRVKNQNIIE